MLGICLWRIGCLDAEKWNWLALNFSAKAKVEAEHGALPKDARTDYPSFSIHEHGENIGGG